MWCLISDSLSVPELIWGLCLLCSACYQPTVIVGMQSCWRMFARCWLSKAGALSNPPQEHSHGVSDSLFRATQISDAASQWLNCWMLLPMCVCEPGMVVCAYGPSTWEMEAEVGQGFKVILKYGACLRPAWVTGPYHKNQKHMKELKKENVYSWIRTLPKRLDVEG